MNRELRRILCIGLALMMLSLSTYSMAEGETKTVKELSLKLRKSYKKNDEYNPLKLKLYSADAAKMTV